MCLSSSLTSLPALPSPPLLPCCAARCPLSVVLQHRRERVNARMRALQGLVPGAAAMTTESFLLEAVHYVRFLLQQVQVSAAQGSAVSPTLSVCRCSQAVFSFLSGFLCLDCLPACPPLRSCLSCRRPRPLPLCLRPCQTPPLLHRPSCLLHPLLLAAPSSQRRMREEGGRWGRKLFLLLLEVVLLLLIVVVVRITGGMEGSAGLLVLRGHLGMKQGPYHMARSGS